MNSTVSPLQVSTTSPYQLSVSFATAVGFSAASLFVMVTAVLSNFLLIALILVNENGHMKTATNYLLINLAVCDLLTAIIVVPYRLFHYIFVKWVLGGFLCITALPLEKICYSSTTLTMMVIALIRFRAVLYPLSTGVTYNRVIFSIILIWILSILVALPLLINMPFALMNQNVIYSRQCEPTFQNIVENLQFARTYYPIFNVITFVIPLTIMSIVYHKILKELQRRMMMKELRTHHNQSFYKTCRSINLMLITMVVAFTLCWAPYNVMISVNIFAYDQIIKWSASTLRIYLLFVRICILLALFSSCINPIICFIYNKTYKRALKRLVCSSNHKSCRMVKKPSNNLKEKYANYNSSCMTSHILTKL